MARVFNFSAGPSMLPESVLREAAEEMLDYRGTGMSVMEMSHRSKAFDTIIKEAEQDLRDIMEIPDNYKVLFLQGGASQQFAAIPMNLMKNGVADYIITVIRFTICKAVVSPDVSLLTSPELPSGLLCPIRFASNDFSLFDKSTLAAYTIAGCPLPSLPPE